MLDAHPELAIPPETHFVPDADRGRARRARDARAAARPDRPARREWGDFGLDRGRAPRALPRADPLTRRATPCAPSTRPTPSGQGKPRWGDKTPELRRRACARIAEALPEARFVPPDPRRPRRRASRRRLRPRPTGSTSMRTRSRALAAADQRGARARPSARPLPRDPLRGPRPRHRADPARVCEFVELDCDDGDARLPRARSRRLEEMNRDIDAGDGQAGALSVERRPDPRARRRDARPELVGRWRESMERADRLAFERDRRARC